jgi:hypothetical protein
MKKRETSEEADELSKFHALLLTPDNDARATDGGFCIACLAPMRRYSMKKAGGESTALRRTCQWHSHGCCSLDFIGTKFGDRQGRYHTCGHCASNIIAHHNLFNVEPHDEKSIKLVLSVGLLLRRDVSKDFSIVCNGLVASFCAETVTFGDSVLTIPCVTYNGKCLCSATVVLRRGCRISASLDRRPQLLLDCIRFEEAMTEAKLLARTKQFYSSGFRVEPSIVACKCAKVSDTQIGNAALVLSAATPDALSDRLWAYVARSNCEGGAVAFLGVFMLEFILLFCSSFSYVSGDLLLACKLALDKYATTSWGTARIFNTIVGKRVLKSWSPQDKRCEKKSELSPVLVWDQRLCFVYTTLLYHSSLGLIIRRLLQQNGLPDNPWNVSFALCEVRKYFGLSTRSYYVKDVAIRNAVHAWIETNHTRGLKPTARTLVSLGRRQQPTQ